MNLCPHCWKYWLMFVSVYGYVKEKLFNHKYEWKICPDCKEELDL